MSVFKEVAGAPVQAVPDIAAVVLQVHGRRPRCRVIGQLIFLLEQNYTLGRGHMGGRSRATDASANDRNIEMVSCHVADRR